jgi:hypothetical protein
LVLSNRNGKRGVVSKRIGVEISRKRRVANLLVEEGVVMDGILLLVRFHFLPARNSDNLHRFFHFPATAGLSARGGEFALAVVLEGACELKDVVVEIGLPDADSVVLGFDVLHHNNFTSKYSS